MSLKRINVNNEQIVSVEDSVNPKSKELVNQYGVFDTIKKSVQYPFITQTPEFVYNAYDFNIRVPDIYSPTSFHYNVHHNGAGWYTLEIDLRTIRERDDFDKLFIYCSFKNSQKSSARMNLWRGAQPDYVAGFCGEWRTNIQPNTICSFTVKLTDIWYPEKSDYVYFWFVANSDGVTPTDIYITDLVCCIDHVDNLNTEPLTSSCIKNPSFYIKELVDGILDVQIDLQDDQKGRLFAPVSTYKNPGIIDIYETDEYGNYLDTFNRFRLIMPSNKGIQYLIDVPSVSRDTDNKCTCGATISIFVDWDKLIQRDAYRPILLYDECYGEHEGLIKEKRKELKQKQFMYLNRYNKNILASTKDLVYRDMLFKDEHYPTDYFILKNNASTGNGWVPTNKFVPNGDKLVKIKFHYKTEDTVVSLGLWLSDGYAFDGAKTVKLTNLKNNTEMDFEMTFDPSYYYVYKHYQTFSVWLELAGSEQPKEHIISNFYIYQEIDDSQQIRWTGETLNDVIDEIATDITDIKDDISEIKSNSDQNELVSPSGKKYIIEIDNNGTIVTVPVIPTKCAMFGNSLLSGSGYGMAASRNERDYFYLINNAIRQFNPSYTATRMAGVAGQFEGAETQAAVDAGIQKMVNALSGDEDLITIQLGDNVNTQAKQALWGTSTVQCSRAIRMKCPNARVIWMAGWYMNERRYNEIQNACWQTGCKFINFKGLTGPEANSYIGALQLSDTANRTVINVTSVVENTPNNITVMFSVNNVSYTTTMDVNSYSLNGTTLSYNGSYNVIQNSGVASHPGDEGFRRIANRFLYESGIVSVEEYYQPYS